MDKIKIIYSYKFLTFTYACIFLVIFFLVSETLVSSWYMRDARSYMKKVMAEDYNRERWEFNHFVVSVLSDRVMKKHMNSELMRNGRGGKSSGYMLFVEKSMIFFQIAADYDFYIKRVELERSGGKEAADKTKYNALVADVSYLIRKFGIFSFYKTNKNRADELFVILFDADRVKKNSLPRIEPLFRVIGHSKAHEKAPETVMGSIVIVKNMKMFENSDYYKENKPLKLRDNVYFFLEYAHTTKFAEKRL